MNDLTYALEMRGITKRFPGVVANDKVDFAVRQGEIHALLGENGAGKSTLMNILDGLYRADDGQILIDQKPVHFSSPRDAIAHGIGMVHQHFMLVPTQTVAENLILGKTTPRFYINYRRVEQEIADLSAKYNLAVDPKAYIWQLSVGEQQRVEILKMLYQGAKILIMDEPTAVLTPEEVTILFDTMRSMAATGHTIIFISHKLAGVIQIADRVTVLRQGKVAATVEGRETSQAELARLMVGREVLFRVQKKPAEPKEVVLAIDQLCCDNDRGLPALQNLSLQVRAGEILGIAGVAGNGQTELADLISGQRQATSGTVTIHGQDVTNQRATTTIDQGVAYIPADRTGVGSVPNLDLSDNLILKSYRKPPVGNGWRINRGLARNSAHDLVGQFNVKTPSIDTPARLLSGGNLQKLILAREISSQPSVIIAVYPVRGLDVGAIEAIHQMLIDERDRGAAILLISEDLEELLSLSDRIVVMFEGQIMGEVPLPHDQIDRIGSMMAGTRDGGLNRVEN